MRILKSQYFSYKLTIIVLKWVIFFTILLNYWNTAADTITFSPDTLTIENSDIANYMDSDVNDRVCGLFAVFITFIALFSTTIILIGINLILLSLIFNKRFLKGISRLIGIVLILVGLLIIISLKSELT